MALLLLIPALSCAPPSDDSDAGLVRVRVATYNIEDLRSTDFARSDHPRLMAAARTIQTLRPDILLINEIAYDQEGVPGFVEAEGPGSNGKRFVDRYLRVPQDAGLAAISYDALSFSSNTGVASGHDLDNDGRKVVEFPRPEPSGPDGAPPRQTRDQRSYGNDSWGFGTFPGQYSMAVFVTPEIEVIRDSLRSFQQFRWSAMPEALEPITPETDEPWYSPEEWNAMRLSAKNHVDVPVRLANGAVLHLLISHPTPPAFDGPELRNKKRNHDEIRFWVDYIGDEAYIVDDHGRRGGLSPGERFVVMGDLNADPDEGSSFDNPIGKLMASDRVNGDYVPVATHDGVMAFPDLDPDDTAEWGLRVDYVLPSENLRVAGGGVWRPVDAGTRASDHFPVFADLDVSTSIPENLDQDR